MHVTVRSRALHNTQLHVYGLPRIICRIKPRADKAPCNGRSVCKLFLLTEAFSAKFLMIVFSSISYEAHIIIIVVLKSFER